MAKKSGRDPMPGGTYFGIYQDAGGEWRWRLVDGNARIVATSGESYTREPDAVRAIRNIIGDLRSASAVYIATPTRGLEEA